jgi:hypothetical protein
MEETMKHCIDKCPVGQQKYKDLLEAYNSIYEAVIRFRFFVEDCSKTCPYKNNLNNN